MGILLAIGCSVVILAGAFSCGAALFGGGVPGVIAGVLFVGLVIYLAVHEDKEQGKTGQTPWKLPWVSKKGDGNIRFYDDPFWGEATRGPKKKPPWAP